MKKEVDFWDYAGHIMQTIPKGCLLTTAAEGKVNTMVIGWGHIGIEWSRPTFIVYVRGSRYTKELLDKNGEFTVNVSLSDPDKNIISVCGTKSGRDLDKFAHLGLTPVAGDTVSVPGIKEMPLTLECKVIYKQDQDPAAIDPVCDARFYAKGTPNEGDYHTAYYGEITKAYILE
ncbi:MAG: flavin reductase family protein [Oscillospiraceae bacterium]|nr:flavin reductase family protein [Oscillospiraceae bacterium]